MKKFTKIMLICSFVFVLGVSVLLTGCDDKDLENLTIYSDFKTVYYVGDELDVSNGKLIYTDKKGKELIVSVKEDMISSFSTVTEGEYEMIITYNNKTILYSYTVNKLPAPVDVVVGDLYYLSPSILSTQNGLYDYIYIKTANTFSLGSSSISPENMTDDELSKNTNFNFIKSTSTNNKIVYTYSQNNAYGSGSYTIVVLDANHITLSIVGTDPTAGNINLSGTFTKVVR